MLDKVSLCVLGSIVPKSTNMAILQTKKQTDLEKRLKVLRQQIYGKTANQKVNTLVKQKGEFTHQYTDSQVHKSNTEVGRNDISYLYQDLFKIGILATCALGIQIILFFLIRNHILVLNFF